MNKEKLKVKFLILVVLMVTFFSYLPSLKNGFVNWDDPEYVTENPSISHVSPQNIKNIFTEFVVGNYHPVTMLTYSLEHHFFKLNPVVYHATNLVLHLFNCILVFWFIFLISKSNFIAFTVALFFGIHPMHVESVAWVSQRKDVLYALFYLGALVSYFYYLSRNKNLTNYYVCLILFILSCLSKPMAITFPFILLLIDFLKARKFDRAVFFEKLPFFILAAGLGVITFFAQQAGGAIKHDFALSLLQRVFIPLSALFFYIIKMSVPLKLSCIYPFPDLAMPDLPQRVIALVFIISALSAAVIYSRKYTRKAVFGSLFFLISIIPTLQFLPFGWALTSDRYAYLPSIGLFYLIAELCRWLYARALKYSAVLKAGLIIFFSGLAIIMSILTSARCRIWNNSLSLFDDVISQYPGYAVAYDQRGAAYLAQREYDKAVSDYTKAVELNPHFYITYTNRGAIYAKNNEYDRAILDYNKAIEVNPKYEAAYDNRGTAYGNKGEFDLAIADYAASIEINPRGFVPYYNRGLIYAKKGEYDQAIRDYTKSIENGLLSPDVYFNRGVAFYNMGVYEKAILDYSKVVDMDPRDAKAYGNRGAAYSGKGDYARAIADFTRALEINPNFARAYNNRAVAYYQMGDIAKALEDANKAQSLGYKVDENVLEKLRKQLKMTE